MRKVLGATVGMLVLVALALAIIPTTRDEIHWRWTSHRDETASYEAYLNAWPTGGHAVEARARYDEHGWAVAQAANTVQAFERYGQLHPDGKHVSEVKERIESLEFKLALSARSPNLLREFTAKYPNSKSTESALKELASREEAEWEETRQSNSTASYKAYLGDYPDGDHTKEAHARIRILGFQSGFKASAVLTDDQIGQYIAAVENETYSTVIQEPIEYYLVTGPDHSAPRKDKVVIRPSRGTKACSLTLEAGNLSVTALYADTQPPVTRALFPQKWPHTMVHTGYAGPGLEIDLRSPRREELGEFLNRFSIFYRVSYLAGGGVAGFVIPDLIYGSDVEGSSHPHRGRQFRFVHDDKPIVVKVDGVEGMPDAALTTYREALALKTYLGIVNGN